VIASPCTGPFLVTALVFIASSGNLLLGFLVFFAVGLGMGSVFFAAGSLNLLMRPGPWMVWVRYLFGAIMVGAALYYLASAGKLVPPALFYAGFAIAVLVALAVARHLVVKEAEETNVAYGRAAKLAVMLAAATGVVAFGTRHSNDLPWTTVTSREQLVAEVEAARKEGQPVVVDVWATWCTYCRKYDDVIEGDEKLLGLFRSLRRLRLDLTGDDRPWEPGLRSGLGIPSDTQPYMVFLDTDGKIRRELDVTRWLGSDAATLLTARVETLKGQAP
jgi:thiol:disulfide interchange protein DsbD